MTFRATIFIFILILSINVSAQKNEWKYPPGVVNFGDTLMVDMFPIQNLHYLEFLYYINKPYAITDIKQNSNYKANPETEKMLYEYSDYFPAEDDARSDDYLISDTLKFSWIKQTGPSGTPIMDLPYDSSDAITYYMLYPGYRYFPLVNVSYFQAKEYCKWRSMVVNLGNIQNNKKYYKKIEYRLPSSDELVKAYSLATHLFERKPIGSLKLNESPLPSVDCPAEGDKIFNSGKFLVSPIYELTEDKKIVKLTKLGSTPEISDYKSPSENIGFRCICEYVK